MTAINNIYQAIPSDISEEIFESLTDNTQVKIERIISQGHSSPESGWHNQDKDEWVIILKGEAKLLFYDNTTTHLKAGDYINIPSNTKHKVLWTKQDMKTIWLAIHY